LIASIEKSTMPVLNSLDDFLQSIRRSGLLPEDQLQAYLTSLSSAGGLPDQPSQLAGHLVRDGLLTSFQAKHLLAGKYRGLMLLGKYRVLEGIGVGGMGKVFLCQHHMLRRQVAIKILPRSRTANRMAVERFYREARAVAALDHPNIVRCFDVDHDGSVHFMVMEYVDGPSLESIVSRHGPLTPLRAAHYVRQAALGLQHAHEGGWVHRDIKPANILLDRLGTIKILDLGLARLFSDEADNLTQRYSERAVLGTADYIAPEQALASHDADIRADIYSLGATSYFLLTGHAPFREGSVPQKLIWHQMREPQPIREQRPDVEEGLETIVRTMMAKAPAQRYQTPADVARALEPWTATPISPPSDAEMVRPEVAVFGLGFSDVRSSGSGIGGSGAAAADNRGDTAASARSATPTGPPQAKRPASAPPTRPLHDAPSTVRVRALRSDPSTVKELRAVPKDRPGGTVAMPAPADVRPRSRRQLAILAGVTVLLLGAGGALYVTRMGSGYGPTPTTPAPASAPTVPSGPEPLKVTRNRLGDAWGKPNTFESVRKALGHARRGDRIVLLDEFYEERLELDGKDGLGAGVTIESGRLPRSRTVWRLPADLAAGGSIVSLTNVRGLRLRGITFDGEQRVSELLTLAGSCAGLGLEDLELRGFNGSAARFQGCAGTTTEPVRCQRVRTVGSASRDVQAALLFEAPKEGEAVNEHLEVSDCRFEGPCQALVRLRAAVTAKFHRNRFYRAGAAFAFPADAPAVPLRLTLAANTFCDISAVFDIGRLPAETSEISVRGNLFAHCRSLLRAGKSQTLARLEPLFPRGVGNACDKESARGLPSFLNVRPVDFELTADPADDQQFLRYPKSSPLVTAGPDNQPVGVPPD
jgi:serine/threonine protein kinase